MSLAPVTPMLVPMTLHDQNSHFAPHFKHLDIRSIMILLTMPSDYVMLLLLPWYHMTKTSCCTLF